MLVKVDFQSRAAPICNSVGSGKKGRWRDVSRAARCAFSLNSGPPFIPSESMSPTTFRVRRAVLDDLPTLRPLWNSMRFPAQELEKRLTEFQVVEDENGNVAGAVALEISQRHGRVHSEAFEDFAMADSARPLIWERFQSLIRNHGVVRVWTREQAPFWKQNGFQPASPGVLKKLPVQWNDQSPSWLTLQLKDEEAIVSLEKELAMYMEAEKNRTARTFQQARALKFVATLVAIVFALFVLGAIIYLFRRNPQILTPGR